MERLAKRICILLGIATLALPLAGCASASTEVSAVVHSGVMGELYERLERQDDEAEEREAAGRKEEAEREPEQARYRREEEQRREPESPEEAEDETGEGQ